MKTVEVMLLGTYHMGGRGSNVLGVERDDPLSAARQRELEALTGRLAGWKPDFIAVEYPREKQDDLDRLYGDYVRGKDVPEGMKRTEIVQIGFRLARKLGHPRLLAVDYFPDVPSLRFRRVTGFRMVERKGFEGRIPLAIDSINFMLSLEEEIKEYADRVLSEQERKLRELSVAEYLHLLNREPWCRLNDTLMLTMAIKYPRKSTAFHVLSLWFVRNMGIVRNLFEAIPPGTEKVILLYGAGHLPLLRYVIENSLPFRYVSPLPYLK